MTFLYEQLNTLKSFGIYESIPSYIQENINPEFMLRPYQINAFENFINYFENDKMCRKPTQTLFHMATGSGKTMIMAGLMIYLYKKGYRNFLFFVNLSNIVKKTKENFLNSTSSKFLFAEEIRIGGELVRVKEVENFQNVDDDAINICFTTTQGLHLDMWTTRENGITIDDFDNKKVVLISDEAHHLNVDTKTLTRNKEELDNHRSWEYTVRQIFEKNKDNILLEFTATCDLSNINIKTEYENKIIFDYPLAKFRADGFSKEIKTLRTDVSIMERAIQAIVLSQYRLKVFQDNRLSVKPVVLFKSAKIADSNQFKHDFHEKILTLSGSDLRYISQLTNDKTLQEAYSYFEKNGISFDQLAQELREDFSESHCISANDDKEAELKQIALNSLEDKDNPYRAVFEVKKLDEGWDVLNLFDIVRLYETRQSGGKKSPTTMSEAQLIGRGARYCPFKINDEQEKYKRKYDADIDNPIRICEELHYHCQNDSRYINELNTALREIGIDFEKTTVRENILKEEFKNDRLYKEGLIFLNERVEKSRNEINGLLPSVRNYIYTVRLATGNSGEDTLFENDASYNEKNNQIYTYRTSIKQIAEVNYAIVHKALCKFNVFKFNILKSYFPNLKSTKEFILDANYLGEIRIEIVTRYENPSPSILYEVCVNVLEKIANSISSIEVTYEGTKTFKAKRIYEVFKNKKCNYSVLHDGGIGYSQNDITVPSAMKIDLSKEDWYAFEDNFGTSEEKAFVAYFKSIVSDLRKVYDKVYLIRNERQLHIYSFDGGERFEPDFVLFLHTDKEDSYEQMQIFIEPKGTHLIESDKWKEDFLLQLKENALAIKTFVDDNEYHIWGFHFYNRDERYIEFNEDINKLLK